MPLKAEVRMEKILNWWRTGNRITLGKALLAASLPALCCLAYCASQGRSLGEVYLPSSEWNDELFYYKQVEGIVKYGYPLGYFGFNESHALKLSFAAWSPVLVFPWIIWGLLFGWNLMSPILCNIFLMTLCTFLFVWLTRPTWKQLGVLAFLFCLYAPFVRYMLSVMPEVICFSMLILFYAMAYNYLRREKAYKLALLFLLSGVMTLMRPYMLLFLLLPMGFWIRRSKWKGAAGSVAVLAAVLGLYACIKHYFGAAYFAPLFFTDWAEAFFEQGLFGGIRYTFGKLYYMGRDFFSHTMQGLRTGLASGAFFAGFLICMGVLAAQSFRDWNALRREPNAAKHGGGDGNGQKPGVEVSRAEGEEAGQDAGGGRQADLRVGRDSNTRRGKLVIEAHLAFSFLGMLFALLLMYKLTEGSKHLLTFIAAAIFVISLMETKFYKKAALVGVAFAYLYSYKAVDPYDYQAPFVQEERRTSVEAWRENLVTRLVLNKEGAPSYKNVVIWVFNDKVDEVFINTQWQLLYSLPEGFGISCCMPDYIEENFDSLQGGYLCVVPGGPIEEKCIRAGYVKLAEAENAALYKRY